MLGGGAGVARLESQARDWNEGRDRNSAVHLLHHGIRHTRRTEESRDQKDQTQRRR